MPQRRRRASRRSGVTTRPRGTSTRGPGLAATLARLPKPPARHRIELRQQGRIAGLGRGDERHVEGAVGADGAGGVLAGEGAGESAGRARGAGGAEGGGGVGGGKGGGEPLDQAVRLVHVL